MRTAERVRVNFGIIRDIIERNTYFAMSTSIDWNEYTTRRYTMAATIDGVLVEWMVYASDLQAFDPLDPRVVITYDAGRKPLDTRGYNELAQNTVASQVGLFIQEVGHAYEDVMQLHIKIEVEYVGRGLLVVNLRDPSRHES